MTLIKPFLPDKVSVSGKSQLNYSAAICDVARPGHAQKGGKNIRCNILILRVTKVLIVGMRLDII